MKLNSFQIFLVGIFSMSIAMAEITTNIDSYQVKSCQPGTITMKLKTSHVLDASGELKFSEYNYHSFRYSIEKQPPYSKLPADDKIFKYQGTHPRVFFDCAADHYDRLNSIFGQPNSREERLRITAKIDLCRQYAGEATDVAGAKYYGPKDKKNQYLKCAQPSIETRKEIFGTPHSRSRRKNLEAVIDLCDKQFPEVRYVLDRNYAECKILLPDPKVRLLQSETEWKYEPTADKHMFTRNAVDGTEIKIEAQCQKTQADHSVHNIKPVFDLFLELRPFMSFSCNLPGQTSKGRGGRGG